MTIPNKWEFFPITFYTTKYQYRKKTNEWIKNQLVPLIEKDLKKESTINENWDCNSKTSFHLEKNIMNAYKHLYYEKIEEFLEIMNVNKKMLPKYEINSIWYNSYDNLDYQERHDHFPEHFSMIHYLQFDSKEHYGTKFFNPCVPSLQFTQQQIFNRMNQQFLEFDDVEEGDMIFFPSFVQHLVKPNKSHKNRITIALNLKLT